MVEACRRAWWALFAIDRQISVLYDREPLLNLDECEVNFPSGDPEYEQAMAVRDAEVAMEGRAPSSLDLLGVRPVILPLSAPAWFVKPRYPMLKPLEPGQGGKPPFGRFEYYVALLNLFDRIRAHRRSSAESGIEPWVDSLARNGIVQDLEGWYDGLPGTI